MDTPSLQQFEIFLEVARSFGFTAAAKKLGVTKAAVSHSIKNLEKSLQVPLFIRTTRSISLTDEGRLLYDQCQRLQAELDVARSLVGTFRQQPQGTLRISTNPYLAERLLLPTLEVYQKKYSNVDVEILIEERLPDLHSEEIDIVFGVNWPAPDDVIARKIGETRYMLVASPAYLKKYGVPQTIEDLKKQIYIPHCGRASGDIIVDLKKPIDLSLNTPLKINNAALMKTCAIAGMGIIQLHDYMIKEEIESGKLVEILPGYLNKTIPLYIYYHKYRFVQPKIRNFLDEYFRLAKK